MTAWMRTIKLMALLKWALIWLAAALIALISAYGSAANTYQPKPPEPGPIEVIFWIIELNDGFALALVATSAITAGISVYSAFTGLTPKQVEEIVGRRADETDKRIEQAEAQTWLEGQASQARDEQTQAAIARNTALLEQIVADREQEASAKGVNAEKLRMLARRIVDKVSDVDEAERALSGAIDELLKLRAEAERGTNFGNEVDEAIRRIFARVEANDLEGAEKQGRKEFERLKEQAEEVKAAQISLAESNLSVARIAYDAPAMAEWALERRKLSEGVESLTLGQLRAERQDWYEEGERLGDRLNMAVAIDLAQRSIALCQTPQDRAMCQINLGNSLLAQGERSAGEEGRSLLARAVEAYEVALSVYFQKEAPAQWAITPINLGNALRIQGVRSEGEAGLALLTRAVAAYEAALIVCTQEQSPPLWAMTQNNLGNALLAQGERSEGEAGLSLLARAVEAYEAALSVRTQKEAPADWAMTQNNLGAALQTQGERSEGEAGLFLLAGAVAAYEAALSVRTQKKMPAGWAATQNNLGNALLAQGQRSEGEAGLSLLARAVAACEAALSVYTQEEAPPQWAMTQNNLGEAEEARGDLSAGPARLQRYRAAEDAVLAALDVFDADTMGYYHEKAMQTLTRIREKIAAEPGE